MTAESMYEGKRFSYNGKLCTIRYSGTVEGKEGTWLGVEWDDARRGKHSGTFEGKRYFACKTKSPHAASFLRAATTSWDPAQSLLSALKTKYASTTKHVSEELENQAIVVGGKRVEEVGYEKIGRRLARLDVLENIILDGSRLSTHEAEDAGLSAVAPNTRHLDISRNLFERLEDVLGIIRHFPRLESLVLSGNRLRDLTRSQRLDEAPFTSITSLDVNDMLLSAQEISCICKAFPHVAKLSASGNDFAAGDDCSLPNMIQELTLSDNGFESLWTVQRIVRSCRNLSKLKLSSNRISTLGQSTGPLFTEHLESLDLSDNEIRSWDFIEGIRDRIPSLRSLQILGNPLYTQDRDDSETSMLAIARLPNLQVLNLSKITEKVRLQAETFYLFQIGKELSAAPAEQEAEIIASHPRYKALCNEYGEPTIQRSSETGKTKDPGALAQRLLTCRFFAREPICKGSPTRSSPLVLRLPKTLNLYAVIGYVARHIQVTPMEVQLIWETGERDLVRRPANRSGAVDWSSDSDDDEATQKDTAEWVEREVELVPSTRPLETAVEAKDAWIRIQRKKTPRG